MAALAGRDEECQLLDSLVAAASEGLSATLVLRGEPGIGKTALLDHIVGSAEGFTVGRVAGIESEMEFDYAGLHQLLVPFLPRLNALPSPQRHALASAFGLETGPPPSRFLITLATLTLLANAAATAPVLCVVDDAQWIDGESAASLAAVARRLHADGIAMLIAVREPAHLRERFDRLPTRTLTGVAPDAARSIVYGALGNEARRDRSLTDRIIAEARGNPLYLLTLATDRTAAVVRSGDVLHDPLPIGGQLEARYLQQTRSMSAATRTLLLTAAAEPTGDRDLLWLAGEALGFEPSDGDAAREFLDLGSPVAFHHPLMRSAIYYGSTPAERRRVHSTLAAVTTVDSDRRAWHRAAAVDEPDEDIAQDLQAAADRAVNRGGLAAAAALLRRAARLTAERNKRAERLVAAAQAEWLAGSDANAMHMAQEVATVATNPFTQARARRLHAAVAAISASGIDTWRELIDDVIATTSFDLRFARETVLDALAANMPYLEQVAEVARIGTSLALPPEHVPSASDRLLDGLCLAFGEGDDRRAAPLLREAFLGLDATTHTPIDAYTLLLCACMGAAKIGDYAALHDAGSRLESMGRHHGAPMQVYIGLTAMASADHGTGALSSALRRRWSLDDEVIRDHLPPQLFIGDVIALAWRGEEHAARELGETHSRWMADHNRIGYQPLLDWALAVLENSLGNYDAALERALRAHPGAYLFHDQVLMELVEAAVRSGHDAIAADTVDHIADRAQINPTPLFAGFLARSRALTSADEAADDLYREAIDRFAAAQAGVHLARARLIYGEWLRRQRRRTDARQQLRDAYTSLVSMDANGFAERARHELVATGEKVRKRSVEAARDLTPQEERIARLAAAGDTNDEIATTMYLSASTVEYHLRKVYRKLDITSRRDLRRLLPPSN